MIKSKLSLAKNNNSFVRLDPEHKLDLFIGRDDKFNPAFEFRGSFKIVSMKSTESISVNQFIDNNTKQSILRFSLLNEDMMGVFLTFCEDILKQTKNVEPSDGFKEIINRFNSWKRFFLYGSKSLLIESQIMGLIGEILFLKDTLSHKIGYEKALDSWSGQDLTHKDFSYGEYWYEIKTKKISKNDIQITSLEQLDSDKLGFLITYSFEKMSDTYNGISLNKLFEATMKDIDNEILCDKFLNIVSRQGYLPNSEYDKYVFSVNRTTIYKVDSNFPKLTKDNVQRSIVKASYSLDEHQIVDFISKDIEV